MGAPVPAAIFRNRPAVSGTQISWVFQATPGATLSFYWTCALADPASVAQGSRNRCRVDPESALNQR